MGTTNIAFTLCSVNYLAQAQTLFGSLQQTNPGWQLIIGLVDRQDKNMSPLHPDCTTIEVDRLQIPGFDAMVQQYTVVELLTSVKPFYFEWLFNNYPDAVNIAYFDPDIMLFQPLDHLEKNLEHFDIVLTPHFTSPINDDYLPTELHVMQTGVFNLGFIALRRSENVFDMLHWWKSRLKDQCRIDLSRGLFVDQLWANLIPAYFDKVLIEKHPGYNMAHWNLHERRLEKLDGVWMVNGQQLLFYHFSHYSPLHPQSIAAHHNRFTFESRPDLKEIFEVYSASLIQNKYAELRGVPCFYLHNEKKKKRKRELETFMRMALPDKLKGRLKNLLRK